jgi:UPF0271 protein
VRIDLNADVGESLGPWPMGDDERLIPLVTSVNVACGAHAGDPLTIERTIRLAIDHGVAVGGANTTTAVRTGQDAAWQADT